MPDFDAVRRRDLLKRAVCVWIILIAIEFIHGVLRAMFLVPVVGDFRSRQIGVFTGSVLIFAVTYMLLPWLRTTETKALIGVGALWVMLTVAFELGFGHYVFGRSWMDLASDYDIRRGGFLLIGMAVMMLAPLIAARMR